MNQIKSRIELEKQIKTTKQKMLEIGITLGLDHPDTVKKSQELDQLLNKYQKSQL